MRRHTKALSAGLTSQIGLIREAALQLRGATSSPKLLRRLDRALDDLETLPGRFQSEEALRLALNRPIAWIRNVRDAIDKVAAEGQPRPHETHSC